MYLREAEAVEGWRYWYTQRPKCDSTALVAPMESLTGWAAPFVPRQRSRCAPLETGTRSKCPTGGDVHPTAGSQCGIRAMRDRWKLADFITDFQWPGPGVRNAAWAVFGKVRMWGRVYDSTRADPFEWPGILRGEFCDFVPGEPLYASPMLDTEHLHYLGKRYGVEVIAGDRLPDEADNPGEASLREWIADPFRSGTRPPDRDEVAPGLWQGSGRGPVIFGSHPFDLVVTVAPDLPWIPGVEEWSYPFEDILWPPPDRARLRRIVRRVTAAWQEGRRVLVRCHAGLNRSGLVVASVLIATGYDPQDAIAAVRAARGNIALFNQTYTRMLRGRPAGSVMPPVKWPLGAAGVLLVARTTGRVLLLQRAERTDHPGTWGVPGGLLNACESPWQAAQRECREETGFEPARCAVTREDRTGDEADDHWRYTTFTVPVMDEFEPTLNAEHTAARWVAPDEALRLPLHPDLGRAWSSKREALACASAS